MHKELHRDHEQDKEVGGQCSEHRHEDGNTRQDDREKGQGRKDRAEARHEETDVVERDEGEHEHDGQVVHELGSRRLRPVVGNASQAGGHQTSREDQRTRAPASTAQGQHPRNEFASVSKRLSSFFEEDNYTDVRGLFLFGY